MVVCNANFGETGWVGINENELAGDVIMSSVAKMNEFYLRNAEYDHRYVGSFFVITENWRIRLNLCFFFVTGGTQCVTKSGELQFTCCTDTFNSLVYSHNWCLSFTSSHGFGLPHTDENPYNTNLGNRAFNHLFITEGPYTSHPNLYPWKVIAWITLITQMRIYCQEQWITTNLLRCISLEIDVQRDGYPAMEE